MGGKFSKEAFVVDEDGFGEEHLLDNGGGGAFGDRFAEIGAEGGAVEEAGHLFIGDEAGEGQRGGGGEAGGELLEAVAILVIDGAGADEFDWGETTERLQEVVDALIGVDVADDEDGGTCAGIRSGGRGGGRRIDFVGEGDDVDGAGPMSAERAGLKTGVGHCGEGVLEDGSGEGKGGKFVRFPKTGGDEGGGGWEAGGERGVEGG
jgi:hypothetical protein